MNFLSTMTFFSLAAASLLMQTVQWPKATPCNDGTPSRIYAYLTNTSTPAYTLIYLEGGGFCFDATSCGLRWNQSRGLMSSAQYASTHTATGFLAARTDADVFYFRYCTSDSFSGNATVSSIGFSFMGGAMVRRAFEDRAVQVRSKQVIFAGSSAGAEGLYPHADWLQAFLGKSRTVRVLLDSGFFLASPPFHLGDCKQLGSCTEQGALQRGVPLWASIVDSTCALTYTGNERWKCMQGPFAARFLNDVKYFVFQFLFDSAQMGHDGASPNSTYAQQSARNLTALVQALPNASGFFLASCFHHTILEQPQWSTIQIGGIKFTDAFARGLRLSDKCQTANCNPSCP